MSRVHKTAKGTELPVMNLRGKDYLEVKYRLVWFREERPDWGIETEFVSITANSATARASIKDSAGRIIAMSHKSENEQGFADFLEKAETGAIGRALALIGYGTQFCADEFDEGSRIVDSPAAPVQSRPVSIPRATSARSEQVKAPTPDDPLQTECALCGVELVPTKKGDAIYCPNYKDKTHGNHSYIETSVHARSR